jgi:DNA-binding MarR family transcriptional regulator
MTRVVSCLEDQGLVTRAVDPADRRVARVTTTAAGEGFLERSRHRKDAFLAARLQALGDDDRAAVARAAEVLERLLEAE